MVFCVAPMAVAFVRKKLLDMLLLPQTSSDFLEMGRGECG